MENILKIIKKLQNELKNDSKIIKGSLYKSKIGCMNKNCKKCKSGEKHAVIRFTFKDVNGKNTSTTISKNDYAEIKIAWEKYKDLIVLEKKLRFESKKLFLAVKQNKSKRIVSIRELKKVLKKARRN